MSATRVRRRLVVTSESQGCQADGASVAGRGGRRERGGGRGVRKRGEWGKENEVRAERRRGVQGGKNTAEGG